MNNITKLEKKKKPKNQKKPHCFQTDYIIFRNVDLLLLLLLLLFSKKIIFVKGYIIRESCGNVIRTLLFLEWDLSNGRIFQTPEIVSTDHGP